MKPELHIPLEPIADGSINSVRGLLLGLTNDMLLSVSLVLKQAEAQLRYFQQARQLEAIKSMNMIDYERAYKGAQVQIEELAREHDAVLHDLKHVVLWFDQLKPSDIERYKETIARTSL